jgi:hypothetical protein
LFLTPPPPPRLETPKPHRIDQVERLALNARDYP